MAATSDAAVGSIVGATMRLTVLGDGTGGDVARVDLVVPVWAEVADVARAWLEATGAPEGAPLPVLRRTTGAVLDPEGALERSGLRHGAVLLAGDPGAEDPAGGPGDDDAADPRPGGVGVLGGRRAWTVVVAALAVVTGALAAGLGRDAGEGSGLVGTATTVCLAVATLLALLPVGGDHVRAARLHVAPFCLAGAALVGLSPSSTHPLLPVTVAALAALATAAAAWALGDDDAVTLVWLWSAGLLSAACVVLLLTGAGAAGLWALLLVGGVVAVRLLPSLVVDVPDETLLDLETLAVTAWSAHDEPRPTGRRRPVVRRPQVRSLARRSGTLLRTSTAGAVAVLVAGALLLLPATEDASAWSRVGAQVAVGAAAAAVALVARGYRDWRLQVLLRAAAGVLLVALAASLVRVGGATGALVLVLAAVVVGVVVVGVAVALGHGWRSVWWARVADVLQGLGFAVTLAALPLASGLFDFVWRFTS